MSNHITDGVSVYFRPFPGGGELGIFFPRQSYAKWRFQKSYFPLDEQEKITIPTNFTLIFKTSLQNYL